MLSTVSLSFLVGKFECWAISLNDKRICIIQPTANNYRVSIRLSVCSISFKFAYWVYLDVYWGQGGCCSPACCYYFNWDRLKWKHKNHAGSDSLRVEIPLDCYAVSRLRTGIRYASRNCRRCDRRVSDLIWMVDTQSGLMKKRLSLSLSLALSLPPCWHNCHYQLTSVK